jgi:hypothetical protein
VAARLGARLGEDRRLDGREIAARPGASVSAARAAGGRRLDVAVARPARAAALRDSNRCGDGREHAQHPEA